MRKKNSIKIKYKNNLSKSKLNSSNLRVVFIFKKN